MRTCIEPPSPLMHSDGLSERRVKTSRLSPVQFLLIRRWLGEMEKKADRGWKESGERQGGRGVRRRRHTALWSFQWTEWSQTSLFFPLNFSPLQGCDRKFCHTGRVALTPRGSPAHATPKPTNTHFSTGPLLGARILLCSGWLRSRRLQPDLQVIHASVCLPSVSVVVSSCREPTVSSALGGHASASLTTSWIPAPDVWPIHRARKSRDVHPQEFTGIYAYSGQKL